MEKLPLAEMLKLSTDALVRIEEGTGIGEGGPMGLVMLAAAAATMVVLSCMVIGVEKMRFCKM